MAANRKVIHGDDLIYRFLRDLFANDPDRRFGAVARSLIAATAIWFPIDLYSTLPVLTPFVVRDPSARGGRGNPDEWSSPDSQGYLRDDNSMIKGLPRSLDIHAPAQPHLNGRRMGTEFVAAHVWRVTTDGGPLASRRPLLNSFVPNLVWVPSQIAKLTDLEGQVVQRTLQGMSWLLYHDVDVHPATADIAKEAWALLPPPDLTHMGDVTSVDWNFFIHTDRFLTTRFRRIDLVRAAATEVLQGITPSTKVVSTRYTEGLPTVDHDALRDLRKFLDRFSRD